MFVRKLIKKVIVINLNRMRCYCTSSTNYENIIARETEIVINELVPEIKLHLITSKCRLYYSKIDDSFPFESDPFFLIFWIGGIALTRYVLDNRDLVRDKSILDFGSGSGSLSIAAKMCGAKRAVANDIDKVSSIAAQMNARLNNVVIETEVRNLINHPKSFNYDVIFFGDVFYDEQFAGLLVPWIEKLVEKRIKVMIGDPGRHAFNACRNLNLKQIQKYTLPESVCNENHGFKFGYVWEVQSKIINGELAADGQFPHMVQFSIRTSSFPKYCGGSLISDQWVLTAAHCFKGFEWSSAKAYLGSVFWRTMPLKLKVIEVVTHPSYININAHDIALVKLEKKINFTSTIQPVSLPSKSQRRSEKVLLVPGFGETKNASQSILYLRYTRMKEISNEECSFDWGWKKHDSLLCAIGVESLNHTTCKGDSGSGIVEKNTNGATVLGLVSYGNPGCLGKPKVFTRVASYLDFIHEVTEIEIDVKLERDFDFH